MVIMHCVAAPTLWKRLTVDIRNTSSHENIKYALKDICSLVLLQINDDYWFKSLGFTDIIQVIATLNDSCQ